ncbi:hypothetical protein U9M48_002381 [Paspalum notatum var. saurae]|uniref:Uncharacterized protein n=1 Tax=Paspalum notatum var. saurae TaxID=547442 RepID=A0AAQ3PKW5_PASNO
MQLSFPSTPVALHRPASLSPTPTPCRHIVASPSPSFSWPPPDPCISRRAACVLHRDVLPRALRRSSARPPAPAGRNVAAREASSRETG